MSVINDRYDKLKNIYSKLIEAGFIDEGEIINYDHIIKNLYHLNLLMFKTYKIFKSEISEDEMILKLLELRDTLGNKLLDKKIAKMIIKKHKKSIIEFYDKIYNAKKNKKNVKLQEKHINSVKKANRVQKGGYEGQEYYSDNKIKKQIEKLGVDSSTGIEKLMNRYGPKVVTRLITSMPKLEIDKLLDMSPRDFLRYIQRVYGLEAIIDIETFLNSVYSGVNRYDRWLDENKELLDMFKNGANMIYNFNRYIFDWIFFPVYSMENLPIVGTFIEIPLDIIGVIIDNSSLVVDPLAKIIPLGLNIITDLGSAIPAVGTVVSVFGVGTTVFQKPMEYMLQNGPNLLGMYLNLSRKEFGLAYLSAMEIFPLFSDLVDASVTNMFTINKHLRKSVRFTEFFSNLLEQSRTISKPFLVQPQIMFQPREIWDKAIYPNRKELPIIKNIPFDLLEKFLPLLTKGPKNVKEIMEKALSSDMNIASALKQGQQLGLDTFNKSEKLKSVINSGSSNLKKYITDTKTSDSNSKSNKIMKIKK